MTKGWKLESIRHSLAAKGIKTKFNKNVLKLMKKGYPKSDAQMEVGNWSDENFEFWRTKILKAPKGKTTREIMLEETFKRAK